MMWDMLFHSMRQGYETWVRQNVRRTLHGDDDFVGDKPIQTPEEIETNLRLPVLGSIEQTPKVWPNPYTPQLVTIQDPCAWTSEAFLALRTRVQVAMAQCDHHTLLVTGPERTLSQSILAANLATAMAQAGQTVVLLDADLQAPQIRSLFALHVGAGLLAVLQDQQTSWVRALVMTGVKNLITVAAEPPEDTRLEVALDPAALLGSPRMRALLQQLQTVSDLILINAPALPSQETLVLARQADWAIVVIEHDQTRQQAAQRAIRQLRQTGIRVLGAVLTEVPPKR